MSDEITTTVHFHSGHNMPGYLPEADVDTFTSWDDAKRSMIDYMNNDADFCFEHGDPAGKDQADELASEMEDLNLDNGPEWATIVGNVAYWITACSDSSCGAMFYVEVRGPGVDESTSDDDSDYPTAVALLNSTLAEWEADGWTIERGWASSGDYAAARATKVIQDNDGNGHRRTLERFAAVDSTDQ